MAEEEQIQTCKLFVQIKFSHFWRFQAYGEWRNERCLKLLLPLLCTYVINQYEKLLSVRFA